MRLLGLMLWGLVLSLLIALAPAEAADQAADQAALRGQADEICKTFETRLRADLGQALAAGGAEGAVAVCQERAPSIAEELSEASHWQVRRTALKLRNQANGPDDWERAGLAELERRLAAGEAPQTLVLTAVVPGPRGRQFRYLRAIITGPACLQCHGPALKPELAAKLQEVYPDDQATGFAPGQLRGAFSLTKPLP